MEKVEGAHSICTARTRSRGTSRGFPRVGFYRGARNQGEQYLTGLICGAVLVSGNDLILAIRVGFDPIRFRITLHVMLLMLRNRASSNLYHRIFENQVYI